MKLKPLHLYQERWYIRDEERTAASNGRDVLVIRDGQEKRPRLPPPERRPPGRPPLERPPERLKPLPEPLREPPEPLRGRCGAE